MQENSVDGEYLSSMCCVIWERNFVGELYVKRDQGCFIFSVVTWAVGSCFRELTYNNCDNDDMEYYIAI